MTLIAAVAKQAGRPQANFISYDVSGQSPTGSSSGTDKPIYLDGVAYRFNCYNADWALKYDPAYPNMFRWETRSGYRAPYDQNLDRPYFRTEITEVERPANSGLEQWIAFDICMLDVSGLQPYPPTIPSGQAMVCQMKVFPDTTGNPLFRIEARSNCVRIATSSNDGVTPDTDIVVDEYLEDPLIAGVPESFLARIVRSADGATNGSCEVWRNGTKIVNRHSAAMGRFDTEYIWRKYGAYCRDTVPNASGITSNMFGRADLSHLLTRPAPKIYLAY